MFVTLWEWHLVFIFMDLIVPVGEINKMTLWGSFLSAEQVSFLQQRTQRQLCAEDERAGVSSCPNHPIFTVNIIRPCICIHHRKPGTGSPSILEVKVSVQYLAKACLMCCLFIEHSMCYFHLLLICKNNKTAICCEKHRVHINCSECLVCNSLRNWVCNSEGLQVEFSGEKYESSMYNNRLWHSPHSPCWLMGSLISSILLSILHTLQHLAEDKAKWEPKKWSTISTEMWCKQKNMAEWHKQMFLQKGQGSDGLNYCQTWDDPGKNSE